MNAQMFNSFLDGTKSAIEMAAIANACGLDVPARWPPVSAVRGRRPRARAAAAGYRRPPRARRHGRGGLSPRARRPAGVPRSALGRVRGAESAERLCGRLLSGNTGCRPIDSGRYAAMYKPFHLIGLELSISVLNAALRGEPTGTTRGLAWRRRGGGQARPEGRRDAGRRGRLHGLGQAGAGGAQPWRWARCRSGSRTGCR